MITNLSQSRIKVSAEELDAFCSRWKIQELSLFGSVIRDDFRPDSDVDVLVSFAEDAKKSFSGWMDMIDELEAIFGRKIDLVDRKQMDKPTANPFRRQAILRNNSNAQALAPKERDLAHLWDMREACRMIQDMTSSLHLESFLNDEQILCATQFELERIGMSAQKVSDSLKHEHPEIAWEKLANLVWLTSYQRRIDCGEIEPERLWAVINELIPELPSNLEMLLRSKT
jgi:predicted nucleotidyltransferase/uncharacterized protein with HEPN domain